MKPTIGRVVLYKDTNGVIKPAIVTYVHNETLINLFAFPVDHSDIAYGLYTSIPQGSDKNTWAWPAREIPEESKTEEIRKEPHQG